MAKASILLIEDDHDISGSLQSLLEDEGCHVRVASNGEEALWAIQEMSPPPDVIFLDLMLNGGMTGWDVLRHARMLAPYANIPVVVITAVSAPEARSRSLEGALLILRKPFTIEDLLSVVNRVCPSEEEKKESATLRSLRSYLNAEIPQKS